MKIEKFVVIGLFDLYNHTLDFKTKYSSKSQTEEASVIMMFGRNGIGKTTILRMIEGLMNLNFDVFRNTTFKSACLTFSNGKEISVTGAYEEESQDLKYLIVRYNNLETKLHPSKRGALSPEEKEDETNFIKVYNSDLDKFSFEFIDTERLIRRNIKDQMILEEDLYKGKIIRKKKNEESEYLVEKVKDFIRDSQVNYSRYFSSEEPELFDRILRNLDESKKISQTSLLERIKELIASEKKYKIDYLGLSKEKWDKKKLENRIKGSKSDQNKLTIIASYLEVLESRNVERMNLAERLLTFEKLLNELLHDKSISINQDGFVIKSKNKKNEELSVNKLSTGEYHLIYLTALALCTKVKGTVIAIDEPEMSMHIGWQRKLIGTLTKISSKASPQMIFATHSPDISVNYSNSLTTTDYEQN